MVNGISLILSVIALVWAIITYYKTESMKRRLRIEISNLTDESHSIYEEIQKDQTVSNSIKKRFSSFIVVLKPIGFINEYLLSS